MTLFLYGAILRERALEVLSAGRQFHSNPQIKFSNVLIVSILISFVLL